MILLELFLFATKKKKLKLILFSNGFKIEKKKKETFTRFHTIMG